MNSSRSIYVETPVRTTLETALHFTQSPRLLTQWDLRFTSIDYLLRSDPDLPQRFHYSRRTRLGVRFNGEGEIKDLVRHADDVWSYTVRFWSVNGKSFIRSGTSNWHYSVAGEQVYLGTDLDYDVRHGFIGELTDRLVMRPLLGWATAWSFDCLRLWLEEGIPPAVSFGRYVGHAVGNCTVAAIWLYQALIIALFAMRGPTDMPAMLQPLAANATVLLAGLAIASALFGVLFVFLGSRVLHTVNVALVLFALVVTLLLAPGLFLQFFNPVVWAAAMIAISTMTLLNAENIVQARRCRRVRASS